MKNIAFFRCKGVCVFACNDVKFVRLPSRVFRRFGRWFR